MGDAADEKGMRRTFIVPAIKAFDHYDFTRAKISCSLTWLVAKAFGSDAVPEELAEPFYRDQYNQEHLKPPVACLLQSAELYCRAGSLILRSDAVKPLLGHNAVIQALAQKGLYVTDQDRLVTERDLTSTPIHMSSHLALIDTLMMAYTVEMVSVERVMACINRCSSAEPSHTDGHIQELPYDTEDAITTWINKVNEHLRDILVEEQKLREASCQDSNTTTQKSSGKWYWRLLPARYRRELAQQRSAPSLPLVDNLLKDNTDGCALTALLHFYCPQAVRLEDICLKETMSLADSLYNLQLVQEFCRDSLNHCCHFSLEDMLYAHASIKSNYLVFMAELFWWFEVVKPSFVQPRVFDPHACEPVSSCRNMAPVSSPVKQSYADRPDSPESLPTEGVMKRSTSMSYVDGCVGTWPKEKRSSSRGISFEIPLDGDPAMPPGGGPALRGMTRSASTDGLGFKVHYAPRGGMKRHVSLMPVNVNGQSGSKHIPEEDEDFTSHKPLGRNNTFSIKNQSRYSNGVLPDSNHDPSNHHGNHSGHISPSTPPSIEEALKIIHDTERPHASLGLGDGDNGFFLHGAEPPEPPGPDGQGDDPGLAKAQLNDHDPNSVSTDEVDTGIHVRTEDIQSLDEDSSSLRDYSDIDPDCEAMTRSCPLPERVERERAGQEGGKGEAGDTNPGGERGEGGERSSPCPSSVPTLPRSHTVSPVSSSGGSGGGMVRMTSFAEQKFRKLEGRSSGGTTPESSELNMPYTHPTRPISSEVSGPPLPITSPSPVTPSPRDPSHLLASEMVHLKMKLEEKRRAIEAQKKKVEAAFTRHRQRMGRTAFLNVVRRKGVTAPLSPSPGGAGTPSPEPPHLTSSKETSEGSMGRAERCKPDGAAPKSPCEDGGGVAPGEIDLGEYTRSIERLNTSLGFLQTEMQRLAQQQEKIMAMRDQQQQAWVIPPPAPSPHRQLRELRSSSVAGRGSGRGSVGSLSPILSSSGSPRAPHHSPAGIKRRPASFHARTPRTPRPNDLKVTPFSRMLNTPTSVDSLPRLRRFTPSQTQLSSFAYLGHDEGPVASQTRDNQEKNKGKEEAKKSAGTPQSPKEPAKDKEDERQEGRRETEPAKMKGEVRQTRSSEVLRQPVSEIQGAGGSRVKAEPQEDPQGRSDLVEVPLSGLKPPDGRGQEAAGEGEAGGDILEDQKMCCGFFYKDDVKGEEDMAAKRAALLEKRLRREKETQERKQQQELDQEQKREAARLKAEEEQQKKDDEKARRDYIKHEYLRRKQLKLMEDMDDVIKPRPGSLKKKPRPKSIHRDVMESPKPPVRATGVRPRGFSVSSVSLASLNLADNDSNKPDNKKTTRGNKVASGHISFFLSSPKERKGRPDSAEGFSSCPSAGSRNGEKDWENESTTSSTPSNAEYTGPKLYKEPSAKSNKHIIQNALAHCCLAGKVNEGQKNKILDEMEKSEANNFLVLFRDAGCQFRSVYTYCPETEEITKLAGIGPKSITTKMIEGLYKYNSDRKQFSHIPAKTMSASVDAITIASHLWQTKKQGTPKKLQPK
ncbi:calmodulin-regulated spectrin-associated protein 2 [Centroberyx affinis]|uniref:calmodulin-regulated spectrin-associated protein 2 n=1 Tax=Centroberyx affinis TaxID=166261 RepID=UPI003A5C3E4D